MFKLLINYFFVGLLFSVQPLLAKLEPSQRLFESEIFQVYRNQYIKQVASLDDTLNIQENDARSFYQKFLLDLRFKENIPAQAYEWFFLHAQLKEAIYQDATSRLNIPLTETGSSSLTEVAFILKNIFQTLETDSKYQKYDGLIKAPEKTSDPFLSGNFPYSLMHTKIKDQEAHLIRMPVPARTLVAKNQLKDVSEVIVNEEFKIFLKNQAAKNQKHLYVSFLNNWKDAENQFFHAKLIELESNPYFGPFFFYLSLDKDSHFYYQSGEFSQKEMKEQFINELIYRLTHEVGYRWPSGLNLEQWNATCIQEVHNLSQKLFEKKKTLTIEERQNFIEITYSRLIRQALIQINPQTYNLTCFYTLDRAPSTTVIFLADLLASESGYINNKEALMCLSFVLNNPLLLHNRLAHNYRIERIVNAFPVLERLHLIESHLQKTFKTTQKILNLNN